MTKLRKGGHFSNMPVEWNTQVRTRCPDGAYKGRNKHYAKVLPIRNPAQQVLLETKTDLLFFTFGPPEYKEYKDFAKQKTLFYFGIIDVDIKDESRLELLQQLTINHNIPGILQLLKPELDIVRESFKDYDYEMYASGSKGVHVYVFRPDLMFSIAEGKKMDTERVLQCLQQVWSSELIAICDKKIYPYGCGIKGREREHPKTNICPFLVESKKDRYNMEFWDFVVQCLDNPDNHREVDLTVEPMAIVDSVNTERITARIEYLAGNKQSDQDLVRWVSAKSNRSETIERSLNGIVYLSGPSWCPIKNGFHDDNSLCVYWREFSEGVWVARCWSNSCLQKCYVLRPDQPVPATMPPTTTLEQSKVTFIESQQSYLPSEVVQPLFTLHPFCMLTAGLGSGKTHQVIEFIRNLPASASVLVIGTRIQQIAGWATRFAPHGFTTYRDGMNLQSEKRLLICLNSLYRLLDTRTGEIEIPNVLIVDEIEAFVQHLGSRLLHKAQPLIFTLVKVLFQKCPRIICMDGLPSDNIPKFFNLMGVEDKFQWLVQRGSFDNRIWYFYNHTRIFLKRFEDSVVKGKRFIFVSNLKGALFKFEDLASSLGVSKDRMLVISGDMEAQDRIDYGDPATWNTKQIVFFNNALGPGVNCDIPGYFDFAMGIVEPDCGANPFNIVQLMSRARHLNDQSVHILVLEKEQSAGYRKKSVDDLVQQKCLSISSYAGYCTPLVESNADIPLPAEGTFHLLAAYDEEANRLTYIPDHAQKVTLRFEPNPLLKLICLLECDALHFNSSSNAFNGAILDIVRRTGAPIKFLGNKAVTKDQIACHRSFLHTVASPSFHMNNHLDNTFIYCRPEQLDESQHQCAKVLARVDRPTIFRNFKTLLKYLNVEQIDKESMYAKEARSLFFDSSPLVQQKKINPSSIARVAKCITPSIADMVVASRALLQLMSISFENNTPRGQFDTWTLISDPITRECFMEHLGKLVDARHLMDPHYDTYNFHKCKREFNPIIAKKYIVDVFKWLGFDLTVTKGGRRQYRKNKYTCHIIRPNLQTFYFRLAMLGITMNGEKKSPSEAIVLYFSGSK